MPTKTRVLMREKVAKEDTTSAKYYIPEEMLVETRKKNGIIEITIFRWRLAGV
jgi:hypothetical protein